MRGHPSSKVLAGYSRRLLAPAQLLALDDHVAKCASCCERLRAITPTRAALIMLWARMESAAAHDRASEHEGS